MEGLPKVLHAWRGSVLEVGSLTTNCLRTLLTTRVVEAVLHFTQNGTSCFVALGSRCRERHSTSQRSPVTFAES